MNTRTINSDDVEGVWRQKGYDSLLSGLRHTSTINSHDVGNMTSTGEYFSLLSGLVHTFTLNCDYVERGNESKGGYNSSLFNLRYVLIL